MESTNTQNIPGLKYRASSVQSLLEQMVSLRKRRSKGEDLTIPSVMLQLSSGREIVGFILDLITGTSGASVVMQTDIDQGRTRVVYTDLAKVEAVSLFGRTKDPQAAPEPPKSAKAPELPKKTLQDVAKNNESLKGRPIVSEADIQKILISFSSMWTMLFDTTVNADVGWSTFSKGPRTLFNLKLLIQSFRQAIEELGTGMRKEELRSQLQNVRFVHGETFNLGFDGGTITVAANLTGSSGDLPAKKDIFNKIEAKMF